jgi:hypothetical protein
MKIKHCHGLSVFKTDATSVTKSGTQKLPQIVRLLKHTDMTIHWKALEEHFPMVPTIFRERIHFLNFPQTTSVLLHLVCAKIESLETKFIFLSKLVLSSNPFITQRHRPFSRPILSL